MVLLDPLSNREREILALIAEGYSNQAISERLFLTAGTVKWYNKQIFSKLDARSRTHAVAQARELGLLDTQPQPDASQPAHNLPAPLTSFIGRESELEAIQRLFTRLRLVTLTGPGGTGKTRLALRAASEMVSAFADGVWLARLDAIGDPDEVASAVASVLDISLNARQSAAERVSDYLSDKHALLVLDNFEQVLDAASDISQWLADAPKLHVLVTSRAALRIYGEQEFAVAPLPLPSPSLSDTLLAQIGNNEAVRLFVERARRARPDFTLTFENAATIASICIRLEGLPLAIELAAARVKLFPPDLLLQRLDSRLTLLSSGPSDLPPRQRALRQTFDWSYNLLDDAERRLFAELAVFVGGWTLDAANAVCGNGSDVTDALGSLIDKSLIRLADQSADEPRFMMLETLREYALEKLTESGRLTERRAAHADWFLALAERADATARTPQLNLWHNRLEADHDNLRAALDYWHAQQDVKAIFRLTGALGWFWFNRTYFVEGQRYTTAALAYDHAALAPALRAKTYNAAGYMTFAASQHRQAADYHTTALDLYRALNDPPMIAFTLMCLTAQHQALGDVAAAIASSEEGIALCKAIGDTVTQMQLYPNYAVALLTLGEYDQARDVLEEGLALAHAQQSAFDMLYMLANLAPLALHQQNIEAARGYVDEGLTIARRENNQRMTAANLLLRAEVNLEDGNFPQSSADIIEARQIARQTHDRLIALEAIIIECILVYEQQGIDTARSLARDALRLAQPVEDQPIQLEALALAGVLAATRGNDLAAARLLGCGLTPETQSSLRRPWAKAEIDRLRQSGDSALVTAWNDGASMTIDEALALALTAL